MSEASKELGSSRRTTGAWSIVRGVIDDDWLVIKPGETRDTAFLELWNCPPEDARLIAAAPELLEALKPFAAYAKARAAMPIGGAGEVVHSIHPGTQWAAEITVAHCEAALSIISKAEGAS